MPLTGFAEADDPAISFNRDIRTLLSDKCYACHGPDEAAREAGLSLHMREDAIRTRPDGVTPITPGNPEASEVFRRITHPDPDERMPPPEAGRSLSVEDIHALKRWIEQGADYETHWAYVPPARPELPPESSDTWVRNPIDAFTWKQILARDLEPAAEADRRTLIRRLSLDLIGLPPTPQEIAEFLAHESPRAYEQLVERLMASPHYGERQAIPWLDAVRYADTWGYHADHDRSVWPYRDYVIDAFNNNKPIHH